MSGHVERLRRFSNDERETFAAIRLLACDQAPYLASSLFRLSPVAAIGLGTFAVDKRWRLYIDPSCFDEWGVPACAGALLHEVGHLIRDHAGRAEDHGALDHDCWNYAGDMEINDDLLTAGVTLPEGVVTPGSYGFDDGDFAENYYDKIPRLTVSVVVPAPSAGEADGENGPAGSPQHIGGDSCGSGAGGIASKWELGDDEAPFDPLDDSDASVARRIAAEEILEHSRSRGTVPLGWSRWAERELSPPKVPWQRVLRGRVRAALSWRMGQVDYSYRRPGRRRIPNVVTPVMIAPHPSIVTVVDTSGSVSEPQLDAMFSEVQGVMKRVGISGRQLRLMCVDAAVHGVVNVRDARRIEVKGRGGTDMRVGIDKAHELKPRPDAIIVMTDGMTPWPEAPTPIRVIALLVDQGGAAPEPPEWIPAIHVDVA
jgi:predicted metal-dependent peptidase